MISGNIEKMTTKLIPVESVKKSNDIKNIL